MLLQPRWGSASASPPAAPARLSTISLLPPTAPLPDPTGMGKSPPITWTPTPGPSPRSPAHPSTPKAPIRSPRSLRPTDSSSTLPTTAATMSPNSPSVPMASSLSATPIRPPAPNRFPWPSTTPELCSLCWITMARASLTPRLVPASLRSIPLMPTAPSARPLPAEVSPIPRCSASPAPSPSRPTAATPTSATPTLSS